MTPSKLVLEIVRLGRWLAGDTAITANSDPTPILRIQNYVASYVSTNATLAAPTGDNAISSQSVLTCYTYDVYANTQSLFFGTEMCCQTTRTTGIAGNLGNDYGVADSPWVMFGPPGTQGNLLGLAGPIDALYDVSNVTGNYTTGTEVLLGPNNPNWRPMNTPIVTGVYDASSEQVSFVNTRSSSLTLPTGFVGCLMSFKGLLVTTDSSTAADGLRNVVKQLGFCPNKPWTENEVAAVVAGQTSFGRPLMIGEIRRLLGRAANAMTRNQQAFALVERLVTVPTWQILDSWAPDMVQVFPHTGYVDITAGALAEQTSANKFGSYTSGLTLASPNLYNNRTNSQSRFRFVANEAMFALPSGGFVTNLICWVGGIPGDSKAFSLISTNAKNCVGYGWEVKAINSAAGNNNRLEFSAFNQSKFQRMSRIYCFGANQSDDYLYFSNSFASAQTVLSGSRLYLKGFLLQFQDTTIAQEWDNYITGRMLAPTSGLPVTSIEILNG